MTLIVLLVGTAPARASELLMFQRAGCPYCEAWDRDIAPIYPKTAEAKRAPLRRVDIDAALPRTLKNLKPIVYTPTFVLMDNGREVGRILGYPGEDFFWALLDELMRKLPPPQGQANRADIALE